MEDVAFQYGFNGKYLKEVVDFWRDEYDFVEREKYINEYFQYKVNIQGLDIHFVHIIQRARGIRIMPMLLLHGWPGSFIEFHKIIPLLARSSPDRDFVFNLVIPSLPGYGYSQVNQLIALSYKYNLSFSQPAVLFYFLYETTFQVASQCPSPISALMIDTARLSETLTQ